MPRTEVFDRDIVLGKVRDLFWDKGYNATSMNDLVETTGLNRSSLYNSFGNKMTLYKTVLIQYQEESQDHFQEALHRAGNPLEAIHFIFENILNAVLNDPNGKGCFSLNCTAELSRSNASIKDYLEKMYERNIDFFQGLVQEGQDAKLINTIETAEHYAYYLMSVSQGLKMTSILVNHRTKLDHIVRNALKVLS